MASATNARSARLVVIPLRDGGTAPQLVGTIRMLVRERVVAIDSAVLVTWLDDAVLCLSPVLQGGESDVGTRLTPWHAVLPALVGHPVADGTGETIDPLELSASFVKEVRDSVPPGTEFLLLVVDCGGPDALVHEFERLPGVRMIYGAVPREWFAASRVDDRVS